MLNTDYGTPVHKIILPFDLHSVPHFQEKVYSYSVRLMPVCTENLAKGLYHKLKN